jgi:hypothetical protein
LGLYKPSYTHLRPVKYFYDSFNRCDPGYGVFFGAGQVFCNETAQKPAIVCPTGMMKNTFDFCVPYPTTIERFTDECEPGWAAVNNGTTDVCARY